MTPFPVWFVGRSNPTLIHADPTCPEDCYRLYDPTSWGKPLPGWELGQALTTAGWFGTGRASRSLVPPAPGGRTPRQETAMAERATQPVRGQILVYFDAHGCQPNEAEYDKMLDGLDALAL